MKGQRSSRWTVALLGVLLRLAADTNGRDTLEGLHYTSQDRVTVRNELLGLPLGGVGAGKVELTTTGQLANFVSLNNWTEPLPTIPGTGFWVQVGRGDARAKVSRLSELPVDFIGSFPFAQLRFGGLPVELKLLGWSPLVFHDPRSSASPLAFFDFEVGNPSPQPVDVTLAFSHGSPSYGPARQWMDIGSVIRPVDSPGLSGWLLRYPVDLRRVEGMIETLYGRRYHYETLDLRPLLNANPHNDPFGDGPGIAFLGSPTGRQEIRGMPFDLVDPVTNSGKGCIILHVRHGGRKAVRIPIRRRAKVIYFLGNIAGWASGGEAHYVIHYADGSQEEIPLLRGETICDWMGGSASALAPAVLTGRSQTAAWVIGLLGRAAKEVEIDSLDFVAEGGPMSPLLFAITLGMGEGQPVTPALQEFSDSLKRTLKATVREVNPGFCISAQRKDGEVGRAVCDDEQAVRASLRQSAAGEGTDRTWKGRVGVLSLSRRLAPGEKARLRFVYTWFAPHQVDDQGYFHGHQYAKWFTDAWDVAQKAQKDRARLYRETRKLYDLIHEATVPAWLKELWENSLNILVANTWWTAGDRYQVYESPDTCPCLDTLDVRYYLDPA